MAIDVTIPSDEVLSSDGRHRRRVVNRDRVIHATLDLFADGTLTPTVADVAARAEVSERSVFRYFADVDDLIFSAMAHAAGHVTEDLHETRPAVGSLEERIAKYCTARIELFREISPVAQAARAWASGTPAILEPINEVRTCVEAQTDRFFGEEFAHLGVEGPAVRAAVEAVTSLDALAALGTSRPDGEIVEMMSVALRKLLS